MGGGGGRAIILVIINHCFSVMFFSCGARLLFPDFWDLLIFHNSDLVVSALLQLTDISTISHLIH